MIFMEPVQSSLKKWMNKNKNFQQAYEEQKQKVLADARVKAFLHDHPEIDEKTVNRNLVTLFEFINQTPCEKCSSVENCNNLMKGYTPILEYANDDIRIAYQKCYKLVNKEKNERAEKLIKSLYMPKEILEARIENIDPDPVRAPAVKEIYQFAQEAKNKLPEKGLYFSGPFGVGKTYLLGALANRLSEYNISSTLIYMPEFVRELRDAIKDDTVTEKINLFKTADVLMLDDIGAETQSAWSRDEVLGSILQYRMMERLPVFFTSNYTMDQLEKQIAVTNRGEVEEIKAGRIMERIRQVSKEVPVSGKNRR